MNVASDEFEARVGIEMRAAVEGVVLDDLLPRVLARRNRRRRATFAAATAVVLVAAGAVAAVVLRPVPPPAEPATPRPALSSASHSRFDVTYVPPGFAVDFVGFQVRPDGGEDERINFALPVGQRRRGPTIILLTSPGADPVTLSDFRFEPDAKEVRIGSRTVIHVRNDTSSNGLNIYDWTEEPGLNVSVDGRAGVSDAEVRRFIAGLRLRPARPVLREPYRSRVSNPMTVPFWSATFLPDGRTMDVAYLATDDDCRRLTDVRVTETSTAVIVTVIEATPSSQATQTEPCPSRGVTAKARVLLPNPLRGRRLLDGSETPPQERHY